jgi:hypothetical protein
MTKQIYVNIAWAIICIMLWFWLAVSILLFSRAINDIRTSKQTNLEILSILKSNNTCNLPYWLQDKIEETYENIVSFECVNE